MSSQSIVCTTCGATVRYGRLSCPECGELLASVAGAARPVATRAMARATERAAPAVLLDVPPPITADAVVDTAPDAADTDAAGDAAAGDAAAGLSHEPTAADATGAAGPATSDWSPPGWNTPGPHDEPATDEVLEAPKDGPWATAPMDGPWAAAPALAVTDREPAVLQPAEPVRSIPSAPGAYVPPVQHAEPAGPPAPARAWAGQPSADSAATKAAAPRASAAGELLDAGRLNEFVGWLAVAGSAMAAVGFLLPWGVSVIGASGVGYFDRWGLAGPFHPIVFVSLLAVLGLSLVPNRIPSWLRVGVLGLGLGALLLGLTWPYLVGLSGTGPGAMVVAVGALVLGAAGLAALATDRHGQEDRAV